MPSMTPIMSLILLDDAWISSIVSTTWWMTSPPRAATPDADSASLLAWRALSAFWRTVEVSSSIDDAVSSSAPACCSVRLDRSRLPAATCSAATAMVSVPARTAPTVRARLSFMVLRACSSWPVSSRVVTSMRLVRSPAATVLATSSARATGRVIERVIQKAMPAASASANRPRPQVWRMVLP